ncbi:cytochrome P450 [Musa troglodytarum]|uniref:Cytochrome P450 n=2 Tax=Musa troglodytarum TaxID=320322 RepID=A0A9E7EM40_9LILI|nr:cytochrome P450 [Musa troglodytarum]
MPCLTCHLGLEAKAAPCCPEPHGATRPQKLGMASPRMSRPASGLRDKLPPPWTEPDPGPLAANRDAFRSIGDWTRAKPPRRQSEVGEKKDDIDIIRYSMWQQWTKEIFFVAFLVTTFPLLSPSPPLIPAPPIPSPKRYDSPRCYLLDRDHRGRVTPEEEEEEEERFDTMDLLSAFPMLASFPFLLFLIWCAHLAFFKARSTPREPHAPASLPPKCYPLVGNLPHFINNCDRFLEWSTELLVASPTGTVTVAPFVTCSRRTSTTSSAALHDFLGRGIFISNGEQWKVQRRAASFEFNTKSLRAFVFDRVHHEAADRLVPLLRQASRNGQVLDLQELFDRFAFDNIISLVFDQDPDCLRRGNEEGERFFRAFHAAAHLSVDRLKLPHPLVWKLKRWLDTEDERRLRESTAVVHEFVDKYVRLKRSGGCTSSGGDLLSRFAEDGTRTDDVVLAGSDTTPAAITWSSASYGLDAASPAGGVHAGGAEEMTYLHAAIAESLRLHPAVPLLPRVCAADDEMPDGTRVRRGWTVMYNSYAMGRAEAIWGKDCGEYRPERWLEVGVFQARSAFQYPVFHAGPRMCLGKEMAVIQMKAITASILEGLDMELAEPRGKHDLSISMRMEGGLPMRFRERRAP